MRIIRYPKRYWILGFLWMAALLRFWFMIINQEDLSAGFALQMIGNVLEESSEATENQHSSSAVFDIQDHVHLIQPSRFSTSKRQKRVLIGYCTEDASVVGYELTETLTRVHSFKVLPEDELPPDETADALIRCIPLRCRSQTYTAAPPPVTKRKISRILGMEGSMYLMNKTNLCAFGAGEASPVSPKHLVPPCFSVSDWKKGKVPPSYLERFPVWIYKPSRASSGHGIRFVSADEPVDVDEGTMQAYVHDPLLYQMTFPGYGEHTVKADLRIFGVVTSLSPLRFYISEHGFFRTGDPRYDYSISKDLRAMSGKMRMVHFTNSSPKQSAGLWKNNTDLFEWESASAGSLQRFLSHIVSQNGLNPLAVWRNIEEVFARLFISSLPILRAYVRPHNIRQRFMTFFADAVVDQSGHVWLYEIHTGCSLKPRGIGGASSGSEKIVAWETRQATWGSMWMGLAPVTEKHLESPIIDWIHSVATAKGMKICTQEVGPGTCINEDDIHALVQGAQEEYISCSHKQVGVFPNAWRLYVDSLDNSDIRFYKFWELLELEKMVSLLRGGNSCPPLVS